jgi:starch synthase (maltosyl-transferring)
MVAEKRRRVVIENVQPEVDCGRFPAKRVVGEKVIVTADVFADGHDVIGARLLHRKVGEPEWREAPMRLLENDRWRGEFIVKEMGYYQYTVEGWVEHFKTWRHGLGKKSDAGQDVHVELLEGAIHVDNGAERASGRDKERLQELAAYLKGTKDQAAAVSVALDEEVSRLMERYPDREAVARYKRDLSVIVDRRKALFSTWYEHFPRSCASEPGKHGTFKDCENLLSEIARMGFDVLYLPPIHPIGQTNRKGKNNSPANGADDPGSPWAIGSAEGGHKAIHPQLGTFEDFDRLVEKAAGYGIEIALDLAYQCSPDHPYVKEHPEWFKIRPDGSVQYAENPPKKYEDIFPINFETDHWKELWEELKSVVLFWIDRGVRIFRVDNPHTKAFPFWEWMIAEIKKDYPETLFLAEAFTRPKVMYRLAKLGFTQSYTYFTWRHSKKEFIEYLTELTQRGPQDFFRPNFWPNTPDILPEYLQYGGRPASIIRLILAATLSSSYGIYGPVFELGVNQPLPGREEYLDSEKYEIRQWDWDQPGNLKDLIARMNRIRRENPAFHATRNIRFLEVDNDNLLYFAKGGEESDIILVVVNLDPFRTQAGWLKIPILELGIGPDQPYLCHDVLSEEKFIWHGEMNHVQLNPHVLPAHIFKVRRKLRRETDFDYFM